MVVVVVVDVVVVLDAELEVGVFLTPIGSVT